MEREICQQALNLEYRPLMAWPAELYSHECRDVGLKWVVIWPLLSFSPLVTNCRNVQLPGFHLEGPILKCDSNYIGSLNHRLLRDGGMQQWKDLKQEEKLHEIKRGGGIKRELAREGERTCRQTDRGKMKDWCEWWEMIKNIEKDRGVEEITNGQIALF